MGRGLSEIQKQILLLAMRRRRDNLKKPEKQREHKDAFAAHILESVFGWKPNRKMTYSEYHGDASGTFNPGWHFSAKDIGEDEYNRVRATLSRSLSRLAERGLVTWWRGACNWSAIDLTDKGIELTKHLEADAEMAEG